MTAWTAFASFLPSLPVAGTRILDLSLSPIMVLPSCPDNTWYFICFAVSSVERNDSTEANVLQAKADPQLPWLLQQCFPKSREMRLNSRWGVQGEYRHFIFVKQMEEGSGLKTRERKKKLLFSLHTGWLYDLIPEIHIKLETNVAVSHLVG